MKREFTVTVERVVRMHATVDVEAVDADEAMRLAKDLVDEHGTHWEEVSTVSESVFRPAARRG